MRPHLAACLRNKKNQFVSFNLEQFHMTAFWYNLKLIKMGVNQTYLLRMCFDDIFIILDVMVDILFEVKTASAKRFLAMKG